MVKKELTLLLRLFKRKELEGFLMDQSLNLKSNLKYKKKIKLKRKKKKKKRKKIIKIPLVFLKREVKPFKKSQIL